MTEFPDLGRQRAMAERITHREDPRIAEFLDIRDRFLRDGPQGDHSPGRFIGEHALIVERMLAIPGCTRAVLVLPGLVECFQPLVPEGVPLYVAEKSVLSSIAGFPIHRGALAVGNRPPPEELTLERALPPPPEPLSDFGAESGPEPGPAPGPETGLGLGSEPELGREPDHDPGLLEGEMAEPLTVVVLEDVTHPDNVGMLFRVAAAFGADAVLLSPGCHDPLYRRAVRLSAGHVLGMPWAWCARWPEELDELSERWGLTRVGGVTDSGAIDIDAAPRPQRIALVVGTESHGLSDQARARLDLHVRIPMAPGIDSLNVSTAAAVMLHALTQGVRV